MLQKNINRGAYDSNVIQKQIGYNGELHMKPLPYGRI